MPFTRYNSGYAVEGFSVIPKRSENFDFSERMKHTIFGIKMRGIIAYS